MPSLNGQNMPAIRTLTFKLQAGGGNTIDLSRELSAFNNRLYRQGMMYHIANMKIACDDDFEARICTVPNTWAVHSAWKMAFQNWLNSNKERVDDGTWKTIEKIGKWNDFRLAMYDGSVVDGYDDQKLNLVQQGSTQKAQALLGLQDAGTQPIEEWKLSEYASTDHETGELTMGTDSFTGHVIGPTVVAGTDITSVGIVDAFHETYFTAENTGDTDGDGDVSDNLELETGVWANLMEVQGSSDEVVSHLLDDYNQPPYARQAPMGTSTNDLHLARFIRIDPGAYESNQPGGEVMVPGFECPLGLLHIDIDETESAGAEVYCQIELVPGSYQGVAAEPIGTPKFTNKKIWKVS